MIKKLAPALIAARVLLALSLVACLPADGASVQAKSKSSVRRFQANNRTASAASSPTSSTLIAASSPNFWFNGSNLTGVDGTDQASWTDLSGNGRTLAAPGTNPKHKVAPTGFNGNDAMRFAGSDSLNNATWPVINNGAFTVIVVVRASVINGGTHGLYSLGLSATGGQVIQSGFANFGSGLQVIFTDRSSNLDGSDAAGILTNTTYVYAFRRTNNTTNEPFINGVARSPSTFNWTANLTTNGFNLGGNPTDGAYFQGDVAEFALFPSALSGASLGAITTALISKYAVP